MVAGCEIAAAVLWLLPVFATGLVALLQYSFGSLFVIGQAVVVALLRTGDTGVADTLRRLHEYPFAGMAQELAGAALCLGAAVCAFRRMRIAFGCSALAAGCAWEWSAPFVLPLLLCGLIVAGCAAFSPRRP